MQYLPVLKRKTTVHNCRVVQAAEPSGSPPTAWAFERNRPPGCACECDVVKLTRE